MKIQSIKSELQFSDISTDIQQIDFRIDSHSSLSLCISNCSDVAVIESDVSIVDNDCWTSVEGEEHICNFQTSLDSNELTEMKSSSLPHWSKPRLQYSTFEIFSHFQRFFFVFLFQWRNSRIQSPSLCVQKENFIWLKDISRELFDCWSSTIDRRVLMKNKGTFCFLFLY